MIKKILCPTDFSSASTNAIEYAARLAQHQTATLTLLHVQPLYMSEGVSLFSGAERESLTQAREATKQLEDLCQNINRTFKVSCSHAIVPSVMGTLEQAIADESARYDLTVIGTNGADHIGQLYFGTHSFRVARKETGPVLIIPENCPYRDIINMAFISDWQGSQALELEQLKAFTDAFKPQLRIAHYAADDTAENREHYISFCNRVESALNYSEKITFERIIMDDEAEAMNHFAAKTHADLVAVYLKKHGFIYRIFHEDVVKRVTAFVTFPVLVFHH